MNSIEKIKLVEIEIFSYCNRKCSFCPNSENLFRQDKTNKKSLNFSSYQNLIGQLKDLNYQGVISFSRYNEPLSFFDCTKKYVDYCKSILPNKIVANTNGDYLDLDRLSLFDELTIMDYADRGKDWWIARLEKYQAKLVRQDDNFLLFKSLNQKDILVFLEFKKNATVEDRGGILRAEQVKLKLKNNWETRKTPCLEPQKFLGIDYNGKVVTCCNMQSDYHKDYVIGDINNTNLVSILDDKKRADIIKIMSSTEYTNYLAPCLTCQKVPGRYTRDNPGIIYNNERK